MDGNNKPRIRVLVVDDSSTIRIVATKVFGSEFDVLLAVDGEDALNVIENDRLIQIVFTDLVMPELDGFELLKKIRKHKRKRIAKLPVIVMTGAENPDIAKQKALGLGATDFITKPFNTTDVRTRAHSYAILHSESKQLSEKTTIDRITGLLNPKGFANQIQKEMAFATRHQYDLSTINIEIDNFKNLFISMGRKGIERLITRIGSILTSNLRKEDTIARVGLARFSASMPLVSHNNAMEMANKICQNVENLNVKLNGKPLKLTVSAGVSHFKPTDKNEAKQLIDAGFESLERALKLGKSQIYFLSVDDYLQTARNIETIPLSIDNLLDQLSQGEDVTVAERLNDAIDRLAPLIALLSHEQKQRFFNYRQ